MKVRRCRAWVAFAASALVCWAGTAAAADTVPMATGDGPGGMNCREFAAAARQAWEQPGGDWIDARAEVHGPVPHAVAPVPRSAGPQRVHLDARALAAAWDAPDAWRGALLLRAMPTGRSGAANFVSREGSLPQDHPALILAWSDGERSVLAPVADGHLPCPSFRSAGSEPEFRIASGVNAVLVFELPQRPGRRVTEATLALTSTRQSGTGVELGLFAARRPGGSPREVQAGLAAAYARDRGLEDHPDVLFVDRFEQAPATRRWLHERDAERLRFVDRPDARAGFEPLDGTALAVEIPAGEHRGMNSHIRLNRPGEGEPSEAYFRYYLRLGLDWDPVVDGGKLPGLSGTYGRAGWGGRPADGSNGWSARGSFMRHFPEGPLPEGWRAVGSYVYHADMQGGTGETWGWNLAPSGLLRKGRWHAVEQHVRLNTPGRSDGLLQAWVDGRLVFERSGLRFRDSNELGIESVWMNVYHGGTRPASRTMTLYIDNLVVARRYIGPMVPASPGS